MAVDILNTLKKTSTAGKQTPGAEQHFANKK